MTVKFLNVDNAKCTGCKACEAACSQAFFKTDDSRRSRIAIVEDTIKVCNQCGECIKACSEGALSRNAAGVVMLDKKKCVGCLVCVGYCPSITMRYYDNDLTPYKCTACGICAKACPSGAIAVDTKELEG